MAFRKVVSPSRKRADFDTETESVCPFCGLGSKVALKVKDGKVKYVVGINGPTDEGRLCVKGGIGFDYIHHEHRLTKPLIRREDVPAMGLNVDPGDLGTQWFDPFRRVCLGIPLLHLAVREGVRRTGITITVSQADRVRLEAIAADRNSAQKHVWRARIILLSDAGLGTHAIMARTGKAKTTVWCRQERFMNERIEGLLRDASRPPGKARIRTERVMELVCLTQEPPPHEATHWTARAMASAKEMGVVTVQRIWAAHGLTPHRWRVFNLSRAPAFAEKLHDVI